jgi:hypothetical protein
MLDAPRGNVKALYCEEHSTVIQTVAEALDHLAPCRDPALDKLNLAIMQLHHMEADLSYPPELLARHERGWVRFHAFTSKALGPHARSVRDRRIGRRADRACAVELIVLRSTPPCVAARC